MIQILKSNGIEAETLSVDRDTKAYDTIKAMLHTQRFDCYSHPILEKEYKMLELVKGKKVDHPPSGSKDVADAVAGVCYWVGQENGRADFDGWYKHQMKAFKGPNILNMDF